MELGNRLDGHFGFQFAMLTGLAFYGSFFWNPLVWAIVMGTILTLRFGYFISRFILNVEGPPASSRSLQLPAEQLSCLHFGWPIISQHDSIGLRRPLSEQPDLMLYWEKFDDPRPHQSGRSWCAGRSRRRTAEPQTGTTCAVYHTPQNSGIPRSAAWFKSSRPDYFSRIVVLWLFLGLYRVQSQF
jgi:hypothetical protein